MEPPKQFLLKPGFRRFVGRVEPTYGPVRACRRAAGSSNAADVRRRRATVIERASFGQSFCIDFGNLASAEMAALAGALPRALRAKAGASDRRSGRQGDGR